MRLEEKSMRVCGRQNNSPQWCHHPIPWDLWIFTKFYFTCKRHFADMIKLRVLRWDYPRLFKWALPIILSVLVRGSQEVGEERRCYGPGLEVGGRGHTPRNVASLKAGKSKKMNSPLVPPEGKHSCRPFWTSELQNLKIIHFCCSKSLSLR